MSIKKFSDSYLSKYNFGSFIRCSSNTKALEVARLFIDSITTEKSLLIIHGSAGNGKTHLAGAVCSEIEKTNPELRIAVVGADANLDRSLECDLLVIDSADILAREIESETSINFKRLFEAKNIHLIVTLVNNPLDYSKISDLLRAQFINVNVAEVGCLDSGERAKIAANFYSRQFHVEMPIALHWRFVSLHRTVRSIEGEIARIKIRRDLGL